MSLRSPDLFVAVEPNAYLDARDPAWRELEAAGAIAYEPANPKREIIAKVWVAKAFPDVVRAIAQRSRVLI
ncbi:MAG: hypothetical protein HY727_15115 [Candidatus Rokubacteria bacterium]|nr:hypothetical protein [Candidatus Rokubacteria bacterium]